MESCGKGRRRKIRRWEWKKQPGYPKRPLSAYNCFYRDERIRMLKEIPKTKDRGGLPGMSKLIAHRWKVLTQEKRFPYEMEAHEEKVKYNEEVRIFKAATSGDIDPEETDETTALESIIEERDDMNRNQQGPSSGNFPSSHRANLDTQSTISSMYSSHVYPISSFKGDVENENISNNERHNLYINEDQPSLYHAYEGAARFDTTDQFFAPPMQNFWSGHASPDYREVASNTDIEGALSQGAIGHNNVNRSLFKHPLIGNDCATCAEYPTNYVSMPLLGHHQTNLSKQNSYDEPDCQFTYDPSPPSVEYDYTVPFDDQVAPRDHWQQQVYSSPAAPDFRNEYGQHFAGSHHYINGMPSPHCHYQYHYHPYRHHTEYQQQFPNTALLSIAHGNTASNYNFDVHSPPNETLAMQTKFNLETCDDSTTADR